MRLWAIHPEYLDNKGLGGLWAEAILARKVLEGKTKGYKNHPALLPFKNIKKESDRFYNINLYLYNIWYEAALVRNLNYNSSLLKKMVSNTTIEPLTFTHSYLMDEFEILQNKLNKRNHQKYLLNLNKYEQDGIIKINNAFKLYIDIYVKMHYDYNISEMTNV